VTKHAVIAGLQQLHIAAQGSDRSAPIIFAQIMLLLLLLRCRCR
jgi:hypothetical protein